MSIANKAILVQLNISAWGTDRKDNAQAKKLAALNNAREGAVNVDKDIMAGTTLAREIILHAGRARTWNNSVTLPWQDKGPRLLPMSYFFEWKRQMNDWETKFNELVDKFVNNFNSEVQIAMCELGSLANPDLYPDPTSIRSKYNWACATTPVPKSGHFCVDAHAKDIAEMVKSCDADVQAKLAEAMRKPWEKLHSLLTHMSKKLAELNEDEGIEGEPKKRIRNTFVDNAVDLCKLLTHMNVTADPELEAARKKLELLLMNADVDDLREYEGVRSTMKNQVDSILAEFEW